jgi:nucleotide-binding universal stress UspA family protein
MNTLQSGDIVVPLDGSKNSEAAVLPAVELSRAYGAPLLFLHVLDGRSAEPTHPSVADKFQDYVEKLLGGLGASDCDWSATVRADPIASTILGAARGARLVVMATHGRGGFQAAFIGSVTDKVVRSGHVPVLTVPVQGRTSLTAGPILVGLDGSEIAEAALPVVRDLAPRLGVGITLLRAYSLPATGSEFVFVEYDTVGMLKEAAEEYLKQTAREGERALTALSSPAAAIARTADEVGAGLVALTAHGRGLAYRLALGSTTDRVLHSVHRPVLVLPAR